MVVVNEEDILIVDSHITPDAANALLDSVRSLSDKPVRYLVNTHFHFDHAHGNQVFREGVEIIGHEYTRERLQGDVLGEPVYRILGSPEAEEAVLADLEEQLNAAADDEARSDLDAQIAMLRRHITALGEVEPTPPNLTLVKKITLFRGAREIQLHHLGRGHTGGDVVVFLPAEKVAFTGDLFFDGAPYLGDAYPEDFVETLERLKGLDFEVIVPGHGSLVRDRPLIDFAQEYLRTYWGQVSRLHAQGLSVEEAVAKLDLSEYEDWATFQLSRPEVLGLEVRRMYRLLEGEN
jgi:glyoxylase-like metal-dependent hydrolase (beta-lactamase superfamily II)